METTSKTGDAASSLERWRRLCLLLAGLWLVTLALGLGWWLPSLPGPRLAPGEVRGPQVQAPSRLALEPRSFADLPGWAADDLRGARAAFARSCDVLLRRHPSESLEPAPHYGSVADWLPACEEVPRLAGTGEAATRAFFERRFRPWRVLDGERRLGLFTGYYEPLLRGRLRSEGPFHTPLYARPPELVTIDLRPFREALAGERIAGRWVDGSFHPYPERAAIRAGALRGRGLELVWVDDPVDAFFLEVQGSGRIDLGDGGVVRVGYAAQNGHPYTALGRVLVDAGELAPGEVSLQTIRRWLREHPGEADAVMARNRSFVFFRRLAGEGPLGSQGVVLTPGRSLAVDGRFLPLGAPLWLDTRLPPTAVGAREGIFRRLLVSQDTGGAIRGASRGDIFFGHGAEAEEVAGRMRHLGRMWILLPEHLKPATT